ncbi:MAG: hypothetical protein RLZZ184_1554 [Cyanobacteriota bacterium]|jgi:hypothetical protein
MENSERDYKISSFNEKLKAVLIELAVNDQLPLDMTTLDASVFDSCTTPLVDALITLQEDAEWALDGRWDRTDSGFEAQIELINSVI